MFCQRGAAEAPSVVSVCCVQADEVVATDSAAAACLLARRTCSNLLRASVIVADCCSCRLLCLLLTGSPADSSVLTADSGGGFPSCSWTRRCSTARWKLSSKYWTCRRQSWLRTSADPLNSRDLHRQLATCTLAVGYKDDNTDQYIIHSMHSANWQLKCLLFEIYVCKYISTADSHQGFIRHSYTITKYCQHSKLLIVPSVLWCCWM